MLSLRDYYRNAVTRLTAAGVVNAETEVISLLSFVLKTDLGATRLAVAMSDSGTRTGTNLGVFTGVNLEYFDRLLSRREQREPLQHILGRAPFRHLELLVGPGVFVPRPETETVVQLAVDQILVLFNQKKLVRVVDLCSGTGAIAIAIATEVPGTEVWAVEKSPEAYRWLERNIAQQAATVTTVCADLIVALPELDGTIDIVISNPPYIPDDCVPRDLEVQKFDPALALYGGADGLDIVRAVQQRALELLRPGGRLIIEHGESQSVQITSLLADNWHQINTHLDLTGRDRATVATKTVAVELPG